MRCRGVQKRLSAYQDGELKPKERDQIKIHLRGCLVCRDHFAELERAWQALADMKEIHPDPEFFRQLLKRLGENGEPSLPIRFRWVYQLFSAPLTTCVLLIAGIMAGIFLGNIVVGNELFPFRQSWIAHSQETLEAFSLRAFDPIPPGTLGDRYLRMASYGEGRRQ